MRIVLEVGDWVLAEDDEGEVRLWSNGVTGETRAYEDLPPEVEAALGSEDGPPLNQPPAEPAASQTLLPPVREDKPPPQAAAPFRRSCGVAAAPAAPMADFAGAAGAAEATTLNAVPAASRSAVPDSTGSPARQGYATGASAALSRAPELPSEFPLVEACEETGHLPNAEPPPPLLPDPTPGPVAEPEPAPVAPRPRDLPELTLKEPTTNMLVKATSMRPSQGQSQQQFLAKLTHIHLAEKGLTSLGDTFFVCPKLRVLNLENNHLQELKGIRAGCEVLHLQSNDVWDLSSWTQNLPSLVTLELSENRLSVLSGLSKSSRLEELKLRSQRSELPLQLHPPALRTFSRSLRVLDISRNRMSDISPVASLVMLQRLDASCNMLTEMPSVSNVLQHLARLSHLHLEENPVCWMLKYRDLVIVAAPQSLEELDGKSVQPNERPFLMELHQRRRRRNSSEPPKKGRNLSGSPAGSQVEGSSGRSSSVGRACPPRPPCDFAPPPGGIPCMARHRSRSSSVDPAARHYRRRSGGATKLPPLPPRVQA